MEEETVERINSGRRKKKSQDRTSRRKVYEDNDPACVNFIQPCKHKEGSKFRCSSINLEQVIKNRKRLYEKRNKIDQDIFLTRLIAPYEPQRKGNYVRKPNSKEVNRTVSISYHLYSYSKKKNVPVCRNFFLKTFSISKCRANLIAKTVLEGNTPKEKRGGDRKSSKSIDKKDKVREFINKLPAKESHYNRMKSKRIYLSSDLNVKELMRLYNDSVPREFKVSRTMFYEIFHNEYNVSFSSLASDTCSVCTLWSNKIKIEKDLLKKQQAMTEKRVHKLRANYFYRLLKDSPPNSKSFCFDLQQQQPLPKTPIQDAFYSRQISLYNFCIMPIHGKNKPFLYTWDETEAGRGAIEIGSAVHNFLCVQFPENAEENSCELIRLFCDGCGGQNKNSHIVHLLMFWLCNKAPKNIQEIHLIFPVRGHSFLPADRVFGRIEKHLKKQPVITMKEDYINIFSKHGEVKSLGLDWKLVDVKSLQNPLKKITGIQSFKRIQLKKKSGRNINAVMRGLQNYRFEADKRFTSLLKRGKRFPLEISEIEQRNCGLSDAKKRDVSNLLIKQFGEEWHELPELVWYKNILMSNVITIENDSEEFETEEGCICLEPDIGDIRV